MEKQSLLDVIAFCMAVVFAAALFCFFSFTLIETVSYRLVVVFLSLIFVSNFVSKLLADYFETKNP